MHILYQRTAGIIIILLWAMLVAVKWTATGSLMKDRPQSGIWLWLAHIFNFLFLLAAIPLAAFLLLTGRPQALDPTPLVLGTSALRTLLGGAGMIVYVAGCMLLTWALLTLRRNYQVGGNAPRPSDVLVTRGPYRFVQHPMYSAALHISLGVALLTQSIVYSGLFCIYIPLVLLMIPHEEEALGRSYGERYEAYKRAVKRLAPPFY